MAKNDTILAHCIARTMIQDAGGEEAAEAAYGPEGEAPLSSNKWLGDAAVGQPFGHQLQDFALTVGQLCEGVTLTSAA